MFSCVLCALKILPKFKGIHNLSKFKIEFSEQCKVWYIVYTMICPTLKFASHNYKPIH